MVYNQIHENLDSSFVCLCKESFIILHGSVIFIDLSVIRNIIAVIILRRLKHRRDPKYIYTQLFQIVKLFYNSSDIPDAVSVTVFKTFGVNLIYNTFFPPGFLHNLSLLFAFLNLTVVLFYCTGNNTVHDPLLTEDIYDQYRCQYKQIRSKCQVIVYRELGLEYILCKL